MRLEWLCPMIKYLFIFFSFTLIHTATFSQVATQDSLVLVTLYNETNGSGWHNHSQWLIGPVESWHGITVANGRVTGIELSHNNLQGNLPKELGELSGLTTLILSGNQLTGTISPDMGNLRFLTTLDLSRNQLTGAIPEELGNMTVIVNFYLHGNQLTGEIPDSFIGLDRVERIQLHENQLSGNIPAGFSSLVNLTKLSLQQNQFYGLPDLSILPLDTLEVSHNNFTFGDLIPHIGILYFNYNPQNKTTPDRLVALETGQQHTLSTNTQGVSNHYQWYKNNTPLVDEDSAELIIQHFAMADTGTYHCLITNDNISGIILSTGNVTIQSASSATDSTALATLYWATDGTNWTDTTWLKGPVHSWNGVTLVNNRVTGIHLNHNNLQGTLPAELGNLTHLKTLNLTNNRLTGNIPSALGALDSLLTLQLDQNQLEGDIPLELGNLTSLTSLELHENNLSGNIPASLGNLSFLINLNLSNNELSGSIPSETGQLDSLHTLSLNNNRLTGGIPGEIGDLAQLRHLSIDNNELTGDIPVTLENINLLEHISLDNNELTGSIPGELSHLTYLKTLSLENNQLADSLPDSFLGMDSLENLHLNNNLLTHLPDLSSLPSIHSLEVLDNQLTFEDIEPNLSVLTEYNPQKETTNDTTILAFIETTLTLNALVGGTDNNYQWLHNNLPIAGANRAVFTIDSLSLEDNGVYACEITSNVVGGLTLRTGNNTLEVITDLYTDSLILVTLYEATDGDSWNNNENWLTGPINTWYGVTLTHDNHHISHITLPDNNLVGSLPEIMGDFFGLSELNLSGNDLSGEIPVTLGNLTELTLLDLSRNQLTGNIPSQLELLNKLTLFNLSNNQLNGQIPATLGGLAAASHLDLSHNQLEGSIPPELLELTNLQYLSLNHNELSEPIPDRFENADNLIRFDVSHNQLTGSIPSSVASLPHLTILKANDNLLDSLSGFSGFAADTFSIENNRLTFDDLESSARLASYSPQAPVTEDQSIDKIEGENLTLSGITGGTYNEYQWFKNDTLLTGETNYLLTLNLLNLTDAGTYYCQITNDSVPLLTLVTGDITLNIIPNSDPVDIQLSNDSIGENLATETEVTSLTVIDPDTSDTHQFSLATGDGINDAHNHFFAIEANRLLTDTIINYEDTPTLRIYLQVTDHTGNFFQKALIIHIIDSNDAPTGITLSDSTIDENQALGTLVATLRSEDEDTSDRHTYSFVTDAEGNDNHLFTILDSTLFTNAPFDYESDSIYTIHIQTEDTTGSAFDQMLTIRVTNVNDTPTGISLSDSVINENQPAGTFIATLTSADQDAGDTHTYQLITNSEDNLLFDIRGDTLVTNAPLDYETDSVLTVHIQNQDEAGSAFDRAFDITITDTNDTPTAISISDSIISENQPAGTFIATLRSADQDAGDTHTYELIANSGDNTLFDIQGDTLVTNALLDYETDSALTLHIQTEDEAGSAFDRVFSIKVTDKNDAPTTIVLSQSSITENQPAGTLVAIITTIDQDEGDTHEYALVTGNGSEDNHLFTINGNQLVTTAVFNYDEDSSHTIRVQTSDGDTTFQQAFIITVTDLNEAPSALSLSSNLIAENQPAGTAIGIFHTTDNDIRDTHIYSLVSGTVDNDLFRIHHDTLVTNTILNFEAREHYTLLVQTDDRRGGTLRETFEILIEDVNESPVAIILSNDSIPENETTGTLVGTLTAEDPDSGDGHRFMLIANTNFPSDHLSFNIAGNQLLAATSFDFEAQKAFEVSIQATDNSGLTFTETVHITITNENDAPTGISLDNTTIAENQPAGTLIGTFSTSDLDENDQHTYFLVEGEGDTDNASFAIQGNHLIATETFDFELQSTYNFRIQTMDLTGASFTTSSIITIDNQPEPFFSTSTDTLFFEPTTVGFTDTLTFIIENIGEDTLLINEVSYPDVINGDLSAETMILAGHSQMVTVTFQPEQIMTYTGHITFNTNTDIESIPFYGSGTTITSTEEIPFERERMMVYPNPADHSFILRIKGLKKPEKIKIYNANGQVIYTKSIADHEISIDARQWKPGIYLIKSEYYGTLKLVMKHR